MDTAQLANMVREMDIAELANVVGVSEPALRLLLGVLLGYPMSIVYRLVVNPMAGDVTILKHLYSFLCGFGLAYFCYGMECFHSLTNILIVYLMLWSLPRRMSLPLSLAFNLTYLLMAYWYVSSATTYDIDWTTAHCVLTLRLMGFTWDYADGKIPLEKQGEVQKISSITKLPNLLEFLGYTYHWGGFLVGPQYSYRMYERFLKRKDLPSITAAFGSSALSFVIGVFYLALNALLQPSFPIDALYSVEFIQSHSFLYRIFYMWFGLQVRLRKYGGIWMLTDGHCILSGLGYAGRDPKTGKIQWDAVTNFKPFIFERATNISQMLISFNVNTNGWVKEYVFKRLRFLGNKHLSNLGSLFFLAIWHGFAPGYFLNFFMEFVDVLAERGAAKVFHRWNEWVKYKGPWIVERIDSLVRVWLMSFTLSYGYMTFELKAWELCLEAYRNFYFIGQIIPVIFIALSFVIRTRQSPKEKEVKKE